jgi:hypothetical protein
VCYHTILLEAGAVTAGILEALVPRPLDAWDVVARPAADGTYLDTVSRSAVVAIVDL